MEKFLGVLFCGGRGTRLGKITKYISKSFVPIYNKPVFKYGLQMLENSKQIDDILILTNDENDKKLRQTGYKTIIQDDEQVFDMFSGWEYIKKTTGTKKNGVLMPSDNISNIVIDDAIDAFIRNKAMITFLLFRIQDKNKLSQMGCYDIAKKNFYYKPPCPSGKYGVIAPYIIENSQKANKGDHILGHTNSSFVIHKGYWFDVGDYENIIEASYYIKNQKK